MLPHTTHRGNLGLDVPPEKMAIVQKQLITSCNFLGKPVIITRVLDSMVNNPRPTRAEATGEGVAGVWVWWEKKNRVG
jgi:pyruvate kinase